MICFLREKKSDARSCSLEHNDEVNKKMFCFFVKHKIFYLITETIRIDNMETTFIYVVGLAHERFLTIEIVNNVIYIVICEIKGKMK